MWNKLTSFDKITFSNCLFTGSESTSRKLNVDILHSYKTERKWSEYPFLCLFVLSESIAKLAGLQWLKLFNRFTVVYLLYLGDL